jgi:hypothetical protein
LVLGESPDLGIALFMNRALLICDRDAASWHRALALPALSAHPNPRQVLVLATGTGGLAAQALALKSVTHVHLVPSQPHLPRFSQQFLAQWHHDAWQDPRLQVGPPPSHAFDVVLSDRPVYRQWPATTVVAQRTDHRATHAVALEGAGIQVPLRVSHRPSPGRSGLSQGHWERMLAQVLGASDALPESGAGEPGASNVQD